MLLTTCYVIIQKIMSPRKSEVDVTIKFCQKQSLQIVFKIGVIKNFVNFTGKHLCWSLLLMKFRTDSHTDVFP